ncbi:type II toxin-antitoxin system VapC family toxin [Planktothrix sp. FACHB-1355]|uniref:Type II toxin-antitoxin system VapC family toxin n=1 Tax=Aerosakkonema funiforme FACHB-1375 TaxID=2949571 RepID=A0A926ZF30_9CYAN|nr:MULTISPECIES: type II toxin-antitoxin system VapC family toxin [Oscillatoriales]MBD2179647.1 type II toxin-antitoxin system VapC family toxin [Aerosakkonema funiforme FACHB-1375]MBD3557964.1 type II toxin-antitoxin system VapC family toxin [Planktothrix sp. FACHB-1355]
MASTLVCVDASFIVRMLIYLTPDSPFDNLWNQWEESENIIVAPTLIYYEITNSFHRLAVAGQLLPEEADRLLQDALNLNITLYGDAELHRQALNLAAQMRLPASYDAHYLALAQQLKCEFWTVDKRLFNAVKSTFFWVHLVE